MMQGITGKNLELVILIGLQASGKTSFFHERFAGSHMHVSKDLSPNARDRERKQQRLLRETLGAGRSIVLDNTNPSRQTRAGAIAIARSLDVKVIGFYFESRLAVCVERNNKRAGKAKVPEVALRATASRLERPTLGEGFAELWYVSIGPDGFVVEPWTQTDEVG